MIGTNATVAKSDGFLRLLRWDGRTPKQTQVWKTDSADVLCGNWKPFYKLSNNTAVNHIATEIGTDENKCSGWHYTTELIHLDDKDSENIVCYHRNETQLISVQTLYVIECISP